MKARPDTRADQMKEMHTYVEINNGALYLTIYVVLVARAKLICGIVNVRGHPRSLLCYVTGKPHHPKSEPY